MTSCLNLNRCRAKESCVKPLSLEVGSRFITRGCHCLHPIPWHDPPSLHSVPTTPCKSCPWPLSCPRIRTMDSSPSATGELESLMQCSAAVQKQCNAFKQHLHSISSSQEGRTTAAEVASPLLKGPAGVVHGAFALFTQQQDHHCSPPPLPSKSLTTSHYGTSTNQSSTQHRGSALTGSGSALAFPPPVLWHFRHI